MLANMLEVPGELIEHKLHFGPNAKPIKQCLQHFAQAHQDRLLDVGFINEVYHPDWLANSVLVPQKNKDWRMGLDYTDLNKAYKKDQFGQPWIYQVMDSTVGCSLLSFLDCYSGYHQISLKFEDQIKTSFITLFGAFCYTTMSFGFKSVGATYQKGKQKCLHI
jgi:hypothetical protein